MLQLLMKEMTSEPMVQPDISEFMVMFSPTRNAQQYGAIFGLKSVSDNFLLHTFCMWLAVVIPRLHQKTLCALHLHMYLPVLLTALCRWLHSSYSAATMNHVLDFCLKTKSSSRQLASETMREIVHLGLGMAQFGELYCVLDAINLPGYYYYLFFCRAYPHYLYKIIKSFHSKW